MRRLLKQKKCFKRWNYQIHAIRAHLFLSNFLIQAPWLDMVFQKSYGVYIGIYLLVCVWTRNNKKVHNIIIHIILSYVNCKIAGIIERKKIGENVHFWRHLMHFFFYFWNDDYRQFLEFRVFLELHYTNTTIMIQNISTKRMWICTIKISEKWLYSQDNNTALIKKKAPVLYCLSHE